MVRARTFSSHHRLCGQPAGLVGVGRFRPLPPHAGHLRRINAMPSDLPLMSTGFATYPVPPQSGQLSGSIAPSCGWIFNDLSLKAATNWFTLRITNKTLANHANRYRLNRASIQSKGSLIPGLPNDATARRSHFLKQSRIDSSVEHVTRIMRRR